MEKIHTRSNGLPELNSLNEIDLSFDEWMNYLLLFVDCVCICVSVFFRWGMFGVNNKQNKVEQFWCHFEDEQQQKYHY